MTAAAFAPAGKTVVIGSQAGLRVLSWPDLKPLRKIDTELVHVHDLAFSPRGDRLLAAGGDPGVEGAVESFSWPEGKLLKKVAEHSDLVYAVDWSPDGKRWASAGGDNLCRVHDADSGKRLVTFDGHSKPVLALHFTPDGKAILSAGIDQALRLWDASNGKPLRALENHVGPVVGLALRPGYERDTPPPVFASVSSDRTVRLWQPTIGRLMRFKKLASAPLAVAWTPDGDRLLVSCADGKLRVIDADSLELLQEIPAGQGWGHTLAVPASGKAALVGSENGKVTRVELRP